MTAAKFAPSGPQDLPPSVNYHILTPCNFACRYCFVKDMGDMLPKDKSLALASLLADHFDKVTFVGGEPMLCPWLQELIRTVHAKGKTTMLVTNGSKLTKAWLEAMSGQLDWLTISIDSVNIETANAIGRTGPGARTPAELLELAHRARDLGMRLKMNTVVNRDNVLEDMGDYVAAFAPERWKVLQALTVAGQNDRESRPFSVTTTEFRAFVARHARLAALGITLVDEDNDAMTGTYAMVNPQGRFFDNTVGEYRYSAPILEAGLLRAFEQVRFRTDAFMQRGGMYDWRK